ncbi:MAG: hypothetical protein HYZ27_02320 [Deltaproteobacteria bacterium]|nr:hypothetical protein [Deltaproteobacteria bacterium]
MRSCVVVVALIAPAPSAADTLAYVRASSQHMSEPSPERFHPLNVVDDDPASMWCEGAPGLGEGEEIRFYFKKEQKIDRVVVTPSSQTGRLINVVRISDGVNSVRIELSEDIVERTFARPLAGATYTVTIDKVGGPNKESQLGGEVTCLADALLYFKDRPFGGKLAPAKLRYEKHRDRVLGAWAAAPLGASEGFLVFAIDGTWEWRFEPILGGRSERVSGEYRFRGNRLLMRRGETGRWADVDFQYRRIKVDPSDPGTPRGDYDLIILNRVLGEKLGGEYSNAEF